MTEVFFYHLERQPLDRVLPSLLEKTLERGWKAVVRVGNEQRLEALDLALWTFRDESFSTAWDQSGWPRGTAAGLFDNW